MSNKHPKVTIVDYGMGNIFSVCRAFEACGAQVILTSQPNDILKAERLVLPGVGAFADGMAELRQRNLISPLRDYSGQNRPFLGICLGMQMMMDIGEEFGVHEGLGIIPGKVALITSQSTTGEKLKVPHIGWNALKTTTSAQIRWNDTILRGLPPEASVYFVHSYAVIPKNPEENNLAVAEYGGHPITAVTVSNNIYGCQFHPERSGKIGLKIIENFVTTKP